MSETSYFACIAADVIDATDLTCESARYRTLVGTEDKVVQTCRWCLVVAMCTGRSISFFFADPIKLQLGPQ
jgi:hypothetical protein